MKTCFKCNKEKPYSEFYKHGKMGDGYLGKCKECTKSDVHANYLKKLQDPEWVEKELDRQREKAKRHRSEGRAVNSNAILTGKKRWLEKNKEKKYAHNLVAKAIKSGKLNKFPCQTCGELKSEAHHEDYSRPLYVTWLCKKHHHERHNELRKLERLSKVLLEEK
jgi:hypothetical protein